jgi:hypothetical protein
MWYAMSLRCKECQVLVCQRATPIVILLTEFLGVGLVLIQAGLLQNLFVRVRSTVVIKYDTLGGLSPP